MSTQENSNDWRDMMILLLASLAAVNCIIVPFLFAQQRPLFPLPGLYFIEIALLGVLGLASLVTQTPSSAIWPRMPWVAAGALFAFVILGAFSIGFFLIPAAASFLVAGILADKRANRPTGPHARLFFLATVIQSAVLLLLTMIT